MSERVQVGDVVQAAMWFATPEERVAAKQHIESELAQYWVVGPIEWAEKHPEDAGVPEPPEGSPRSTRLLVAEATVLHLPMVVAEGNFTAELEAKDLTRLRQITRDACWRFQHRWLTDAECDAVINELGPDAALKALRTH